MRRRALVLRDGDRTALVNPRDLYSLLPIPQLTRSDKVFPLVPKNYAGWGDLRLGDEVIIGEDLMITSVNGVSDPQRVRSRPDFMGDIVKRLEFPGVELPIDFADSTLRELRAIAPLGRGAYLSIEGPTASGKTWTSQTLAKNLLTAASKGEVLSPEKTVFIFLAVGERPQDLTKLRTVIGVPVERDDSFGDPFRGVRRELYSGFQTEDMIVGAQIALERARRLVEAGYDAIFFVDSIWMLVLTLGGVATNGGGLAASGVPREALKYVKDNFFFTGQVSGGGSLTLVATCLFEGPKTSSETVINEIGAPNATARWHHLTLGEAEPRPWIDLGGRVVLTKTREIQLMLKGSRLALHQQLTAQLGQIEPPRRRNALRKILEGLSSFDVEEILARLAKEKATSAGRVRIDNLQQVINAAVPLGRISDPTQAAQAVLTLLKNAWADSSEAMRLMRLISLMSESDRTELAQELRKGGFLAIEPAQERLLTAAAEMRGQMADPKVLVRDLLEALGLDPKQVLAQEDDPVEKMMEISERLKSETGKGFGRDTAERLVEKSFQPDEVYNLLKAGSSPKRLLAEKGISDK